MRASAHCAAAGAEAAPNRRVRRYRERLLDAMFALCAQVGYPRLTVASLSAHAGVSTASFYECFSDKEDCLAAACREAEARVLKPAYVLARRPAADPLRACLASVLAACETDPDAADVLFLASLAGGRRAHAERQRVLGAFEQALRPALDGPSGAQAHELPAAAVTGALLSLLARRSRVHADGSLADLADELASWANSYARSRSTVGLAALGPVFHGALSDPSFPACMPPAAAIPRGRHNISSIRVAAAHRARILHATAQVTLRRGYAAMRVKDIVAEAHVARGVFYEHFASKHEAFLATHDHATTELLRLCWRAYFEGESWPARVWRLMSALSALTTQNPGFAHVCLLDSYAAGPSAIERTDRLRALAVGFFYEGYWARPHARPLPASWADALVGATFEIIRRDLAGGQGVTPLARRTGQLTFIALAPFTGPADAARSVAQLGGCPGR